MVFASFVCRAAGALALAAACSAHAADLTLTIEGVNAAEGRVAAAAYDSAGSWLKGPPAAVAQSDAASPRTVLVLRDVTEEREQDDALSAFAGVVAQDVRGPS